ncbi:hypothetical protein GCM10022244_10940 [Streptomyces gulbargensis]|uniref:Uncharacterized protein n=1 Tax=Streptomyces gulbargensis TaxID=364901 RepID=A0ABP7LKK3_9ACTN
MPEPRERPLKMRSPGRAAPLGRRLLGTSGVVVAIGFSGLRGRYGCTAPGGGAPDAGGGPSTGGEGPPPAGDQDRVGTIARTLAAISAGMGA